MHVNTAIVTLSTMFYLVATLDKPNEKQLDKSNKQWKSYMDSHTEKCKTNSYDYIIRLPNCIPKKVKVKLCAGSCPSMTSPEGGVYCSRCYPGVQKNVTVSVMCPKNKHAKIRTVSYLKIKHCRCSKLNCPEWKPTNGLNTMKRFKLYI